MMWKKYPQSQRKSPRPVLRLDEAFLYLNKKVTLPANFASAIYAHLKSTRKMLQGYHRAIGCWISPELLEQSSRSGAWQRTAVVAAYFRAPEALIITIRAFAGRGARASSKIYKAPYLRRCEVVVLERVSYLIGVHTGKCVHT
jgi:hypothetical protein